MFPNCVMFDLIIEHEIFFEPFRCTYFLFDPTPKLDRVSVVAVFVTEILKYL